MSDDGIVTTNPSAPLKGEELTQEHNDSHIENDESLAAAEQPFEMAPADENQQEENQEQEKLAEKVEEPASFNKRINKAHAEKRAAEMRAKALEDELYRMQRGMQPAQTQQQNFDPYAPVEPDENDPKYATNPKAYMRDFVTYQKNLIIHDSQRASQANYAQNIAKNYNSQIEAARSKYEDFDEALETLISLPIAQTQATNEVIAAIQELDNGADVAYYFAKKNPDDFVKLFNMPLRKAVLEIGKMSAKISTVPQAAAKQPAPPRKLQGAGILHKKKSIEDMSIDDMAEAFRSMR